MSQDREELYNQIDYTNKTVTKPTPDKVSGIDTHNDFYDNIIYEAERDNLDMSTLNSFTSISTSRDQIYNLLDSMANDPIISSALEIYASDACEPNDAGNVVWCESEDANVLGAVNLILDDLNVDKHSYGWVYNLVKYGDLYLRLYRNSEYEDTIKKVIKQKGLNEDFNVISNEEFDRRSLTEDVIMKVFSKNDRYAHYAEAVKNPAEVFDLVRFGKTYGYLRTHINHQSNLMTDGISQFNSTFNYHFNKSDVDIYAATEFVHATLDDNSERGEEEVSITSSNDENDTTLTYSVRRGKSVLYDSFKIWRELSLLENSVLLSRLTKSSILRTIGVETSDMEKNDVQNLLIKVKGMVEQKAAIKPGQSINEYTNPGPMENVIYYATHDGKGALTTGEIGGDVNVGDLGDLKYWKKKLFSSLGIPGQFLGDTEDSAGFNGGSSLALISSRYAKTIKRIQNSYSQAITDAVNLILLDMGLKDYIGKFVIKMQAPTTQEEKDRKDNLSNSISNIRSTLDILDGLQDITRLKITKALLASELNNEEVINLIQEDIEALESGETAEQSESDVDDFGGGEFSGGDFGGEDLPDLGEIPDSNSEPMDLDSPIDLESEEPEESFYSGEGEILNERNDLPSWDEMGLSYDTAIR